MNVDLLIEQRVIARSKKNFELCDLIRNALDTQLVFIFDTKDGQVVYHLNEKYFKNKPENMTYRKYVEQRIQEDIRAEKLFEAWLYSTKASMK